MKPGAAHILLYFILFIFYWVYFITPNINNTNVILFLRKRTTHVLLLLFLTTLVTAASALSSVALCCAPLCHEEVMWPNMCSWLKTRKTDAHLVLLQPASQPRVVLDELLIAQAVLHCGGHVTHPCGCCSARCSSVFSGNNLRRSRELPRAN